MFLRWRHRKSTARRTSKVYVFKEGHPLAGQPWYSEKTSESLAVLAVESRRVNGQPRLKIVSYLGAVDPRGQSEPTQYCVRQIVRRVRDLDVPPEVKERFLKEIEARGIAFAWPESLDPMTQEEWDQVQDAIVRNDDTAERIRALLGR